jgi:hypothetical protein
MALARKEPPAHPSAGSRRDKIASRGTFRAFFYDLIIIVAGFAGIVLLLRLVVAAV